MEQIRYIYKDGNLYDSFGQAVMMSWESDWMKKSADIVCKNGGDILNIGFGLGLVDTFIEEHNPKSHTVIECHPDVLRYMKDNGWYDKVNVIEDEWQNVIKTLPKYDGIYFDTWNDTESNFKFGMLKHLNDLLKVGGIFSFWNNTDTETDAKEYLPNNFKVIHKEFDVDIPKEQYLSGHTYISPELKYVSLPIITKISEGEKLVENLI